MALFKNFIVYRIGPNWMAPTQEKLEGLLQQLPFLPCEPSQAESAGWVPPRPVEHSPMVEAQAGHFLMKLMVERKSVPASAIKAELEIRCKKIEAERGRAVGRKEKKELKEEIHRELLARVFSKKSSHLVWLDTENRTLVIGTGSRTAADQVVNHLVHVMATLGHVLQIAPIFTMTSPDKAMADWLSTQEPPADFTLDRDLELKQPDNEKSVVRYVRHDLGLEEIAQHIANGKRPTQLAMTWDSRVSFVLTDELILRKVEFLKTASEDGDADNFDGDMTLAFEELSRLVPSLISAMAGEKDMFGPDED